MEKTGLKTLNGIKGVANGIGAIVRETELRAYAKGYKAGLEEAEREEPKPCDGPEYEYWDVGDYLMKAMEEFTEAAKAYARYKEKPDDLEIRKDFGRELTDIITAATSTLERAGFTAEERRELQKEINASNAKRDGGRRFKK